MNSKERLKSIEEYLIEDIDMEFGTESYELKDIKWLLDKVNKFISIAEKITSCCGICTVCASCELKNILEE